MLSDPVHPSNLTDVIELLERERDEARAERDEARADLAAETATRAALRLMLRETARTNATGIDYALRCQRERDTAQREIATLRALRAAEAEKVIRRDERIAQVEAERDAARTEVDRLTQSRALCVEALRGVRATGDVDEQTWDVVVDGIAALRTRAEQAEAAAAVEVAETREWRAALMRCAAVADKGASDHVAQNPSELVAFVAETIVGLRTALDEERLQHSHTSATVEEYRAGFSRRMQEIATLRTRAEQAEAERDEALAELAGLRSVHLRGCECAVDDACLFARERDAARAEAEDAARAYNDVAADLRRTAAELAAAQRELHRLSCGEAIEGDGLCPEGIRADAARAWSRLWHREARRLWREVQTFERARG